MRTRLPSIVAFTLLLLAWNAGCKPRASLDTETRKGQGDGTKVPENDEDPAVLLERLRLSNQDTLAQLQIMVIANDKRLLEITSAQNKLTAQLGANNLSEADRTKYTGQQTELQKERDTLEATQTSLKDRLAKIRPKVADIDQRIIALAEELEQLTPEEIPSIRPKIQGISEEISVLKASVSGAPTAGTGTGTNGPNPNTSAPTLPKGTLSTTGYIFYYEEPNVKKDCLDLPADNTQAGASVIAYPCTAGRKTQSFRLENFADQSFRMIDNANGLCVYVVGAAKTAGAGIEMHACADPNQTPNAMIFRFREIDTDKQTFKIQNALSSLCWKINSDGRIIQGDCNTNFTLFQSATVSL